MGTRRSGTLTVTIGTGCCESTAPYLYEDISHRRDRGASVRPGPFRAVVARPHESTTNALVEEVLRSSPHGSSVVGRPRGGSPHRQWRQGAAPPDPRRVPAPPRRAPRRRSARSALRRLRPRHPRGHVPLRGLGCPGPAVRPRILSAEDPATGDFTHELVHRGLGSLVGWRLLALFLLVRAHTSIPGELTGIGRPARALSGVGPPGPRIGSSRRRCRPGASGVGQGLRSSARAA